MKITALILIIVASMVFGYSCKSAAGIPEQLPQTMHQACDLYMKARPLVVKMRAWAIANPDKLPDDIKPALAEIDAYLPGADQAGKTICAASAALDTLTISGNTQKVNWDQVLSAVLRAVSFAVQLKQQGAI